jgi:hypothetical protein
MSLINAGIPFLSHQAEALGTSARRLPLLVRDGELRRVLRGIYVDPAQERVRLANRDMQVASVMGADPALEEEVARHLGVESLKPRLW